MGLSHAWDPTADRTACGLSVSSLATFDGVHWLQSAPDERCGECLEVAPLS